MPSSSGSSIPGDHKDEYHKLIQEGLATGEAIDAVILEGELLSAPARYALEAGGKRLRSVDAYARERLGIPREHIVPSLQSMSGYIPVV